MHLQISKKIFIYLFIFFTLVTINNKKLTYDFYKIKNFTINGLNQSETEQLKNNIKIFKNTNIFKFNKKDISKIIYSDKIIESFKIVKIYPSTLKIDIQKTKFLAITKKNGNDYLVLENGNLIKYKDVSLDLPFIFGDINIDNFIYFKRMIDSSKFEYKTIKNLYYFKSNRWDILTNQGLTLKMPSNLTVQELNKFFRIIQKNNFNDIKFFDFRQKNMMITNE